MPEALILTSAHQCHATSWMAAFARGLERHGWSTKLSTEFSRCDLLVVWGVRRREALTRQLAARGKVCVLERGYLLDRLNDWASVSFGGGLNNHGEFRGPLSDPSRWRKHFAGLMQPWRRGDGRVLIMGQIPGDMSVVGVDLDRFYKQAAKAFGDLGFHVTFRPHPVLEERAHREIEPLAEALASAGVAVTWNSNAGVEAALAGVPTIAMNHGSMAWEVAGHALEIPPTPDRDTWAHGMAWKQWRRGEMENGDCWSAVGIPALEGADS